MLCERHSPAYHRNIIIVVWLGLSLSLTLFLSLSVSVVWRKIHLYYTRTPRTKYTVNYAHIMYICVCVRVHMDRPGHTSLTNQRTTPTPPPSPAHWPPSERRKCALARLMCVRHQRQRTSGSVSGISVSSVRFPNVCSAHILYVYACVCVSAEQTYNVQPECIGIRSPRK